MCFAHLERIGNAKQSPPRIDRSFLNTGLQRHLLLANN